MMDTSHYTVILFLLDIIIQISATTHWFVTENGKIRSEYGSLFHTQQPHNLVAFLEQEQAWESANALFQQVSLKLAAIDSEFLSFKSDIAINQKLYLSDSDCLLAGKPLADIDLYASVVIGGSLREGVKQEDYLLNNVPSHGKERAPDCTETFPLEFSMYTFEHLNAMQCRKNLTQNPEKHLLRYLSPGTDINALGHQLAYSLSHNRTSWIYLNLAAIYWRIRGNAYNALECSRRAIVCAPGRYRDIPLLTTGGVLHAAKRSGEAAIVLHMAVEYNYLSAYHHLMLGHVYAELGNFDMAITCYDNCLRLSPFMTEARQAKHAILCERRVGLALKLVVRRLRGIASEVLSCQNLCLEWVELYKQRIQLSNHLDESKWLHVDRMVQLLKTFESQGNMGGNQVETQSDLDGDLLLMLRQISLFGDLIAEIEHIGS